MNKETLETLVEKESQKSSITSKDIPDLDLYMDQIMTLFETHLANHKKNEDDKLLTKTMINNYSKAKVIKDNRFFPFFMEIQVMFTGKI